MGRYDTLKKNLDKRGIAYTYFSTPEEAADYLNRCIDGTTVGIGGSMTIQALGLYEKLNTHNQVFWHWERGDLTQAACAQVYLTSVNGMAETGELINIDGTCNRISASVYGHQKVYVIAGSNKLEPDFEKALWRARNIAAPKRAQSLKKNTPCAQRGDRCYDCSSPERICRGLSVIWGKPSGIQEMEVVLIEAPLGL